jgi:PAS domain S-box-containing protein
MKNNKIGLVSNIEITNFQAIFEAMPGSFIVVKPDEPDFTVLAVSDELLQLTATRRAEVIGKSIFTAYPENPLATTATGPSNLRVSLEKVARYKQPDQMPVIRYDVKNAVGIFEERYWRASSKPVFNKEGKVVYILITTADVTDTVKAEKAQNSLSELEKIHHLFMEAPVAICMVKGPDYIVELVNDGMLQFLGRTSAMINKPLIESLPEAGLQGLIAILDNVSKTGQSFYTSGFPAQILINDVREQRYFNLIFKPYYDGPTDNEVSRIFCVASNVTEEVLARKKAEQVSDALHFRNALFEAQNQATPDGVLIVDANGKMLLHNKRFAEIWKMPQEVLDNKDDAAAIQHSAGIVADPQHFVNSIQNLYSNKTEISREEILFKDGRVVERNGNPIVGENGIYYGWAWYFRDITERIKQEQKFRNVVEQASDLIVIYKGEDLVVEVANKALLDLWQIEADALNRPFGEIKPEMYEQGFIDMLKRVLHTGEPVYGYETPAVFKRESGIEETRYFNFSFLPYKEVDGTITGVLNIAMDVTEHMGMKQKLVERESLLRNMVEQAPVAIALTRGEDMVMESVNAPMLKIMGNKSKEEVLGKKVIELLPELADQTVVRIVKNVLITGEAFKGEEVAVNVVIDGKLKQYYFDLSYTPVLEDGTIVSVLHVAIDVTERVLARKRLEESERNLRNVILKAPVAMGLVRGPEHVVEIANDRMFEIWGRKEDEVLNKPVFEALPEARNQGFEDILNKVYTTGESFTGFGIPMILHRNGRAETIYVNVAYEAFRGADGTIAGIMSVTVEVTELVMAIKKIEEAEARARLAVEAAEQGTYEINLLTNEVFASPRMAAIFGVEQAASRDRYITAIFPEDQNVRKEAYKKAYQTGRLTYEGRVVHKDMSVHWIRINGKVFFDNQNKPVTILGVVQDITIEKEIERQKDDFISIVSHELKTPITSLKAYAQILTRKYSLLQDQESTGMLNKMNDQVNRLNYIVQDLLDVSRIESNRILFRIAEFDFHELIAQTVEEVQRTTETHKIIIETNERVIVHADRERTSQVLINLLTNAISYSPNGSDVIVANYCNEEEVVCSVKDVGSGIEKEKQARIFERFFRATDVNRYNGGLGLGLYISAEIIKRQNGRIWVESAPGKGSTFYFTVPLKH